MYSKLETLLTFFSMSDIHIVDKESPAQAIYGALDAAQVLETNTSAYSPIILSTTHVLDAAVQTINALNGKHPLISACPWAMMQTTTSTMNSGGLSTLWTENGSRRAVERTGGRRHHRLPEAISVGRARQIDTLVPDYRQS